MAPFNDNPPERPINDRKTLRNDIAEIEAKTDIPTAQGRQQWQQKKNDARHYDLKLHKDGR
jgi:hypothetical protein